MRIIQAEMVGGSQDGRCFELPRLKDAVVFQPVNLSTEKPVELIPVAEERYLLRIVKGRVQKNSRGQYLFDFQTFTRLDDEELLQKN